MTAVLWLLWSNAIPFGAARALEPNLRHSSGGNPRGDGLGVDHAEPGAAGPTDVGCRQASAAATSQQVIPIRFWMEMARRKDARPS